jgi:hypothetical protein
MRMNYKKMKWHEAEKLINESHGMPKAKWEKLWKISRDRSRR